jgi:hypothetical protein
MNRTPKMATISSELLIGKVGEKVELSNGYLVEIMANDRSEDGRRYDIKVRILTEPVPISIPCHLGIHGV